ncbi:hypothetical protein HY224_03365 [Candidatus Uhrbacteria bacterium]|nr:hypothetical protein [Candidatus Uhrbacteria bacterium]
MKKILLWVGLILIAVYFIVYFFYKSQASQILSALPKPVLPQADFSTSFSAVKTPAPDGPKTETAKAVPTVVIGEIPAQVKPEETFSVTWSVAIMPARPFFNAALYYGPESISSPKSDSYPNVVKKYQGTVPAMFKDPATAPKSAGKLYFRARIDLDGTSFWSGESVVQIKK